MSVYSYGLAYCSHNTDKKLLTACQHWNHGKICPVDWAVTDVSHVFQACHVTTSTNLAKGKKGSTVLLPHEV